MGRDPEDYLYDLYAVCNHHGNMQGGHYTGEDWVDGGYVAGFIYTYSHATGFTGPDPRGL